MSRHDSEDGPAGSLLSELIFNQYQAILLGGVAAVSLIGRSPLPVLVWLGAQLVLLPLADSGPLRRWVRRRRQARARVQARRDRDRLLAAFDPTHAKRFAAMETLCRLIESNYQGLHGTSQVYLAEQRGKLDMILDGCLHRMLALQRYDRLLSRSTPSRIETEIQDLTKELEQPELPGRARAALEKNIELKRRLLASYSEARGTMKALSTELDSMASLLEVLHQNSISMRDPQAISQELDTIVRQSEDSERAVREMEALLRSGESGWGDAVAEVDAPSTAGKRRRARER